MNSGWFVSITRGSTLIGAGAVFTGVAVAPFFDCGAGATGAAAGF